MLEEEIGEVLNVNGSQVELELKPYEIETVKVEF